MSPLSQTNTGGYMEKSLALVLPDKAGTLREVMRVLAAHDVSVLRLSYNRVVDAHALFLDVNGTVAALDAAEEELRAWRFFPGQREVGEVHLIELGLEDDPCALEPVLAVAEQNEVNITYVDVRTDGTSDGIMRIAVYVDRPNQLADLMEGIQRICPATVVPRGEQPNMLDNNHFNLSFAHGLARRMGLGPTGEEEILINSNRIMQNLMREGADPHKPFDYINQIGETMATYSGNAFVRACRVTAFTTAGGLAGHCIEPPIGADTWVLECDNCLLCIDSGYRRYAGELEEVLRSLYPCWDSLSKKLVITHADFDHVGLLEPFDEVFASGRVIDNFAFESMGIVNWREQNPASFPYNRIGRVLCGYEVPDAESIHCLGEMSPMGEQDEPLRLIDTLDVAPLSFEVWEGKGGHVRGEIVLIERRHRLCVSGDIFVNVRNQTKPQMRFNTLAPYLTTSVDVDPALARTERTAMLDQLGEGTWQILGGHGALFEWRG